MDPTIHASIFVRVIVSHNMHRYACNGREGDNLASHNMHKYVCNARVIVSHNLH